MDTSRIDSSLLNLISNAVQSYNVQIIVNEKLSDEDLTLWETKGIDLLFMNSSTTMKGIVSWEQLDYLSEYAGVKIIKSNLQIKANTHNLRKIKPSVLFDSFQTGNKLFNVIVSLNRELTSAEDIELTSKEIFLIPRNNKVFSSELLWDQLDFLSNYEPVLSIRPNLKKDVSIIDISPRVEKKPEIKIRDYNPSRTIRPTGSGSGSSGNSNGSGSGNSN